MSVGVILVAAGRGTRLGSDVPKQLLEVGGRSLLRRSVEAFDGHPGVGELVVVLPPEMVADGGSIVGETTHPCRFTAGGARRQDSVREGFAALSSDTDVILIHDAARPFADRALIDRVIAAARETGASVPAVQARDTVKRVRGADRLVSETIPRDEIWLAQTPQGFRRDVLSRAVAAGETVEATDEAMLAEHAGHPVRGVAGSEANIKITTREDLERARGAVAATVRVGTGYDLHRLVEGRRLVLAGVDLGTDRGPLGHSDGDVLCHAIVDAIFGGASLGDIGRHFPNTDPAWKDAPGLDLLGRGVAIVRQAGFDVDSVDATVILERPKLAPRIDEMRAALAGVLGVAIDRVSVKGKTNEGVDAVGRGEAIAAHAVAVLLSKADVQVGPAR
jgi:2-C-methyl-D-erythritol 4-phosphate cytidylyltransferase/2-C-methyl-D-erythritol 2,4-cyclodiphosphate synthase